MTPTCAHPNCSTQISPRSKGKLCQLHIHTPGLCVCVQCLRKRDELPTAITPEPTRRQPSMPVAPWEVGV